MANNGVEHAKWLTNSDSDDYKAFPDWLFPPMKKISEQQSDAAPHVTVPTPEPSASVQPVPALQEQTVLPLPPTLQRHRRYHPI